MENSNTGMREREIRLIDLVVEILFHWRIAIIIVLVGGVLFGGLSYVRSLRAVQTQQAQLAETEEESVDIEALEEELTEEQLNNINAALAYEKMYADKMSYSEMSVFMQLDPLNAPRAELTFLIRTDDMERTYNIEKVYEDLLTGTGLFEYLKEKCGLDSNVNEMIYLEKTSYGEQQGNDTVRLSIVHNDEEVCKQIADYTVAYVEEQQELLKQELGEHEVVLLGQSFGLVMSTSYLDSQKNCMTELINLRTNIAKLKANFSDGEEQYYEYLALEAFGDSFHGEEADVIEEADEEANTSDEVIAQPRVSIKYIILGMILFAFVYVFVIFLRYILNNEIRATDNLQDLYGISQLGFIPQESRKKRFLGVVDQWILALRNRGQRRFTEAEAVKLASVAVKMAAKKENIDHIYLVGCNIKGRSEAVCGQVTGLLEKDGIQAETLNNVLYDAEAMASLEQAKCVVLVEKAGSTLYNEIALEAELLTRQGIAVLGGIVVE